MKTCSIEGCEKKHEAHGWCDMHYARWKRSGDPLGLKVRERGEAIDSKGYRVYGRVREHVAVVEKAMGKALPAGAVIHHVDEDRTNNAPSNLLVCSHGYHMMLHARMRAMAACGNPNWKRCTYCGKYDDPANLYVAPSQSKACHNSCRRAAKQTTTAQRLVVA